MKGEVMASIEFKTGITIVGNIGEFLKRDSDGNLHNIRYRLDRGTFDYYVNDSICNAGYVPAGMSPNLFTANLLDHHGLFVECWPDS